MKTPPISVLNKKFKLRNDRVLSIRTGKIAGSERANGDRYIYIEGRFYNYADIHDVMRQHAFMAKPLSFPVSLSRQYKTSEGDDVRIYALDGSGMYCVHGAYNYMNEWHITQWSLHGAHPTHSQLTLSEVYDR